MQDQDQNVIPASEFCIHHNIEMSFLHSLKDYGLIQFSIIEEKIYLSVDQLKPLERILHFHNELDINLEGIDCIIHLLRYVNQMQEQIKQLTNRLREFEEV